MIYVRLLVIDDDQALTRLLQLELRDYEVITARDGLEGLRLFDGLRPELVVLDIGLPLMDGRTVCQRIREISDVPILMMTANPVREEDIAHALNLGADEFMRKPLPMVEFQARLAGAAAPHQTRRERQTAAADLCRIPISRSMCRCVRCWFPATTFA